MGDQGPPGPDSGERERLQLGRVWGIDVEIVRGSDVASVGCDDSKPPESLAVQQWLHQLVQLFPGCGGRWRRLPLG